MEIRREKDMKVTLTFTNKEMSMDFQMNSDMKIKDALQIISDNSDFKVKQKEIYVFSRRKEQMINVAYSFKESGIYSGDELIVEDNNE